MSVIKQLNEVGQSIWYDNLSLDVLASGELQRLVNQGVSGLTSNPTIFKAAIADSNSYDTKIASLKNLSVNDIIEELMVHDVRTAAKMLIPAYNKSAHIDGYASIEVSPLLAAEGVATLKEAERLWSKLAAPNGMIKIPATPECMASIEEALYRGINVNVTLIFSLPVYRQVAERYIRALERRKADGHSIENIASVASFFVSRVDTITAKKLSANKEALTRYYGKIAVANSRLVYKAFTELFESDRFMALASGGAKVQRPLWASTGVKDPAFDPLMYVYELVGANTVNTLPPKTLLTLIGSKRRAAATIAADLNVAAELVNSCKELPEWLQELEVEGVRAFTQSYRDLESAVQTKLESEK